MAYKGPRVLGRRTLTEHEKRRIVAAVEAGVQQTDIMKRFRIGERMIQRLLKEARRDPS